MDNHIGIDNMLRDWIKEKSDHPPLIRTVEVSRKLLFKLN